MFNTFYIIFGIIALVIILILLFGGKKSEGQDPAGNGIASLMILVMAFGVGILYFVISFIISLFSGEPMPTWLKIVGWVVISPVVLLVVFELCLAFKEKYID